MWLNFFYVENLIKCHMGRKWSILLSISKDVTFALCMDEKPPSLIWHYWRDKYCLRADEFLYYTNVQ